jgi:hypothetical protein
MFSVQHRWLIPRLALYNLPANELSQDTNDNLAEEGCKDFARDQTGGGALFGKDGVWTSPAHEDGDGKNEGQVDKQELEVSKVRRRSI